MTTMIMMMMMEKRTPEAKHDMEKEMKEVRNSTE